MGMESGIREGEMDGSVYTLRFTALISCRVLAELSIVGVRTESFLSCQNIATTKTILLVNGMSVLYVA